MLKAEVKVVFYVEANSQGQAEAIVRQQLQKNKQMFKDWFHFGGIESFCILEQSKE